ncbi:MAG TPA: cache domain-containing protein, partial [Candidatus Limnocylindria bacterium]|nr:cache domain-containing protein [Candidatus Limnocylindria bacterium]
MLIQKPVSLRRRLIVLVVATLAPLVIFAVAMIVRVSDQERRTFERGAIDLARALTTAIESQLRSPLTTLEALATSPSLTDDELAVFQERAERVLKSQRDWVTITLALPSGKQVMDARYGYPLGAGPPATPLERWSFEEVLRTQRPVIGHLIQEPVSLQYRFSVRVPVVRDGAVKYVLTAVLLPSFLKDVLDDQRLPPDWVGVVLDGNRRFVARTVEPERNLGQLASESLRAALDRSSEGWFRGTTLEGRDVYTPFSRSSFSGWTVALGIPAEFVDATFRRSLIYVVLFAGGLLALGLLLAWSVSARTVASINSLVRTADDLGSGKNLSEEAPSSIVEVEAVRRAFVTANRM